MDAFNNLHKKVSPGGFIIVDDHGLELGTCRRAVTDFRALENIFARVLAQGSMIERDVRVPCLSFKG